MSAQSQILAQKAADAIDPKLFEPAIRKAADDFYEQLLTGVQDYLKDNVEFNLSSHMLMLHSQIKTLKDANKALHNEIDALLTERSNPVLPVGEGA